VSLETKTKRNKSKVPSIDYLSILTKLGLCLIALALFLSLIIFYPVVVKEIGYFLSKPNQNMSVLAPKNDPNEFVDSQREIVAVDKEFSIVVPKIGANSRIISDVDPYNSQVYQRELTKGVAHAKGTVYPGQVGNSFYFAHSSDNFYNANRYNSVFYLLNKLEDGDLFYFVYKGETFKYKVIQVKIVSAESIDYIKGTTERKLATLMTCWPAGTAIERLVVVGELVE
jgi:LPXTG-site transpeptidase (sortase) family protein